MKHRLLLTSAVLFVFLLCDAAQVSAQATAVINNPLNRTQNVVIGAKSITIYNQDYYLADWSYKYQNGREWRNGGWVPYLDVFITYRYTVALDLARSVYRHPVKLTKRIRRYPQGEE